MRRDRWLHLWEHASDHPFFVAYHWVVQGKTLSDLAQALGTDEPTAIRLGVCRAPQEGENLDEWAADVAHYLRLDQGRMRQVAENIRA